MHCMRIRHDCQETRLSVFLNFANSRQWTTEDWVLGSLKRCWWIALVCLLSLAVKWFQGFRRHSKLVCSGANRPMQNNYSIFNCNSTERQESKGSVHMLNLLLQPTFYQNIKSGLIFTTNEYKNLILNVNKVILHKTSVYLASCFCKSVM